MHFEKFKVCNKDVSIHFLSVFLKIYSLPNANGRRKRGNDDIMAFGQVRCSNTEQLIVLQGGGLVTCIRCLEWCCRGGFVRTTAWELVLWSSEQV
jgi:hypothetical protein